MSRKILLAAMIFLWLAWPQLAGAQDIGSVRIATVYANPFGTGSTPCTGTAQTAIVPNNGQTGHYISYSTSPQPTFVLVQMQGASSNIAPFPISDAATNPSGGELQASGNYPIMQVSVTCAVGGSFTVSYTGQGVPTGPAAGTNLQSQVNKRLLNAVPVNTASIGAGTPVTTPFGSSSGMVVVDTGSVLTWSGSPTVTVECLDVSPPGNPYATFVFPIPTALFAQNTFPIPPVPCTQMLVLFSSTGSGGSGIFNLSYAFFPPGYSAPTFRSAHLTGTAAVSLTAVPSFLHTVSINTGAAGTISLFDLIPTACIGTPSGSPTVAMITATTSTLQTLTYDVNFTQGICVKASAAMDFTVSYQ